MSVEISDAARLAARGIPITLRGTTYRAKLTFEAVELLETEFGGFPVFLEHLKHPKHKSKRHSTVRKGIVAALVHHKPREQDFVDFEREIVELLEPRETVAYLDAVWLAIMEAFPPINPSDPLSKAKASHGNGSTTSPQPDLVEATASSGR